MMMPVRPPRGMTARQVTMLRRLYTMHIEQQEAIFAQPPSPAPEEAVVTATRAEARKATCRICFSETYAPDGRERPDEKPRPEALVAPCKCDGSQKWVHAGCLRRWVAALTPARVARAQRARQSAPCCTEASAHS